jgi:hypothetical protein
MTRGDLDRMATLEPAGDTGPMRQRRVLVVAAVLYWVVARLLPFGGVVLYPLTLLTTWVHEMGHGLTALLVGGHFEQLMIFRDAAGLAMTSTDPGWPQAAVAAGGLLAPPLLGAFLLAFAHTPRRAQLMLAALAGALVVSLAIWVRSAVGVVVVPLLAALLGWAAWRLSPPRRVLLVQFLAVVLALDTVTRMIGYVFTRQVEIDGRRQLSDIALLAENAGGHYLLWGLLVTAVACGLLALGLWRAWQRPAPRF